jgi:phosphopantetheinyl transferase
MERASRDCTKSAARFLAPRERGFVAGYANPECTGWCAKEALYKYSGRDGLDFLRDIVIEGPTDEDVLYATVAGKRARVWILEVDEWIFAVVS